MSNSFEFNFSTTQYRTPVGVISGELNLKIGEIVYLVGENGVGKSCALSILRKELYQRNLLNKFSFCLQESLTSLNALRVDDLLIQFSIFHSIELKRHDLYHTLDIKSIEDREVTMLSGGQAQKLKLLLCLSRDVSFYLLDEPFNHLDQSSLNLTLNYINELKLAGKAFFIIDHHTKINFDRCYRLSSIPNSDTLELTCQ